MVQDTIRVIVCGDQGVGKSSLITSLVKEVFVPTLPACLPAITIPREMSLLPEAPRSTVLIDTSALLQDRDILQQEIRRAHVIWLVYSDHYTYERVALFWLPLFRSMGANLPIVLAANKCDDAGRDVDAKQRIADEMLPLLKEFKEIESCIRVSAKTHYNVNQAFYLCQRAITHPLSPLYDAKEARLKFSATSALTRIFLLSDMDQDGVLSDDEMLFLQRKCFRRNLDRHELKQIKASVRGPPGILHLDDESDNEHASMSLDSGAVPPLSKADDSQVSQSESQSQLQSSPSVSSDTGPGITLEEFLRLNELFVRKGRHETTWGILRSFHYTDSLSLEDKFLYPRLDVPYNSVVELSPDGYRFLVDLFIRFDQDNDGGLSEQELQRLFSSTPGEPRLWTEIGFPLSTVTNSMGHVTLQGWLAQWSMTCRLDYKTTLAYLAYLGFECDSPKRFIVDGVKVTRPRKKRNPRSTYYRGTTLTVDRTVFNCFVLGPPRSGKSAILDAFVSRPVSSLYTPTLKSRTVVNSVEMRGGKQCYMILEELGELEPAVLENTARLHECDVLCYTYDSADPESFQYLVDLRSKYPQLDNLPALFVGLKADLDRQQQRSDEQPDVYAANLGLAAPLHVSLQWPSSLNELFVQLSEAAQRPGPHTPINREKDGEDVMDILLRLASDEVIMGVTGALLAVGIAAAYYWKRPFN